MNPRARHWAEVAGHAPSGDNSQPWTVALAGEGDRILLTLALDDATRAAPSLFDCAFVASYLSLGAYAKNFQLLAAAEGYALADLREADGRFTLTFTPAAPPAGAESPEAVASLIRRRTTNRLPFAAEPLEADARAAFAHLAAAVPGRLHLREFAGEEKSRLARLFYRLDIFRYRNAALYHEFLGKLRFGAEADRHPDGLRDTTLGVPPPALLFLRLLRALRPVRAVRAIYWLGFERLMAFLGCLSLIRHSAAVLTLTAEHDTPLDWFRLGLGFQDLWLEAARRGLGLQPLGTTLLVYRVARARRLGETPPLTADEQAFLAGLGADFRTGFNLDLGRPCIACRVGRAAELANTSLRRPVIVG